MDAIVTLDSGMRFTASSDSGHVVVMDSDASVGGADSGARPMELILIGLAGCTAMDVISILRKKREDVTGLEVKAHAERAEGHPKVFTAITLEYVIYGRSVKPEAVERAIQLSTEIYCPAQAMLSRAAPINTIYRIVEP